MDTNMRGKVRMSEVLDGLRKRIDESYGESSEINAKLDFAKNMLEQQKITQKLTIQYVQSVLQMVEAHQRCYVKVSSGNCSGTSLAFKWHVDKKEEEGKNE